MRLDKKYEDIINDKETLKIVASIGKAGVVNSAVKQSVHVDDKGNIVYRELIETSETQKNMFFSLWFRKKVSILAVTKDLQSFEIRGIPTKVVIEGPEFEEEYKKVQEKFDGKYDLAAIWYIEPVQYRSKDVNERFEEQYEKYPIVTHLDRVAK